LLGRRLITSRAPRGARARRAAAAALVGLLVCPAALAAEGAPDELRARFVFQLLNYVTWPESALPKGATLIVGVLGDDSFAAALRRAVDGRQAQGRAIEVRTVPDGAGVGVQLLFVRGRDPSDLRELARLHHGDPVLLVADRFDFPKLGGDVGLELIGERVSFSINRRKSERGDLVISSKLLRLASEVK
jgi:hypothetical protein